MPVIAVGGVLNPVSFAPTLLTPANGSYVDLSQNATFTWQYNPGQAGISQSGYSFARITNNGSLVQYWNGTSWQSTQYYITSTSQSVTFPSSALANTTVASGSNAVAINATNFPPGTGATLHVASSTSLASTGSVEIQTTDGFGVLSYSGKGSGTLTGCIYQSGSGTMATSNTVTQVSTLWTNSSSYQWSVSTQDANGVGPFAGFFNLSALLTPSVTVTNPTGTVPYADPLVTWQPYPARSAYQTSYRVVVYTAAQYGAGGFTPGSGPSIYDSGVQGSQAVQVDLSQVPVFLTNGVSFRAYVQITQTGAQTSSWSYSAFTTSYTPPNITSVAAAASNGTSSAPPQVLITVSSSTSPTHLFVTVQRSGSDGSSTYVRYASPVNPGTYPISGAFTVTDYEIVPSVFYTYTAQVLYIPTTANEALASTTLSTSAQSVTTAGWWELNPLLPTTQAVFAQAITWEPQVTEQSAAHLVMGQSVPNVVANTMGGLDGQATFQTFSPQIYALLQTLLQSQQTIFISSPWGPTDSGYVRFGPQTGGLSTGAGNKVQDSSLMASTLSNMTRTTDVTWVAQNAPAV